jgi:hypothetical protein
MAIQQRSARFVMLPSLLDGSRSFVLQYYDLIHFSKEFTHHVTRTSENERFINATQIDGNWDRVGVVGRKLSFWSCPLGNGSWRGKSAAIP